MLTGAMLMATLIGVEGCSAGTREPGSTPTVAGPAVDPLTAKEIVDQLATGQYDRVAEHFDPTMKARLTPDGLLQAWQTVITQAGPYKRLVAVRTRERRSGDDCHHGIRTGELRYSDRFR